MALKQLTLIVFRCPPTPPCFSMLHRGIMLAGSWTDHENISSGKDFTLFRLNHHQIHYILCPRMVYDCIKCHPGKCEISESKTAFTCPLQETCSLRSCHISHSPTPKTGKMSLNMSKKFWPGGWDVEKILGPLWRPQAGTLSLQWIGERSHSTFSWTQPNPPPWRRWRARRWPYPPWTSPWPS